MSPAISCDMEVNGTPKLQDEQETEMETEIQSVDVEISSIPRIIL